MRLLLTMLIALVTVPVFAAEEQKETKSLDNFYGSFMYHSESREEIPSVRDSDTNIDFMVGWDRLFNPEQMFYLGLRAGLMREQVLTSVPVSGVQNRPFIGVQGYKYWEFVPSFGATAGVALDLVQGGSIYTIGLGVAPRASVRLYLTPKVYAEIPVEIEVFPFFDGTPLFYKVGLQVGFGL